MDKYIEWFQQVLDVAIRLYFRQECPVSTVYEIGPPEGNELELLVGLGLHPFSFDEQVIVMLALMPHLCPQALDILFVNNKNFERPYTEFGGWKGISHGGFLPTGETAAFLLSGVTYRRRRDICRLFDRDHRLYTSNIITLTGNGQGEPFLSGRLDVSEEILSRIIRGKDYKPDYSPGFPAKRVTTQLNWNDLVLPYQVKMEVEEINSWIKWQSEVMETWDLGRFLKAGYRSLFYGPPGTGKTLTATLLGKQNRMDVYRVDLSMIVSKYIGETEKNLAHIFDLAENRNWILFFDEADALFGKRTSTNTSNDRHANQEVAYLLQRIEDFPGTVILATNLRSNIDEAFSRRFQSIIFFPMPDESQRAELWTKMLHTDWLKEDSAEMIKCISRYELSGGSISNVIRRCALYLLANREKKQDKDKKDKLDQSVVEKFIQKELYKEGKI